jgi:hypothetical protein
VGPRAPLVVWEFNLAGYQFNSHFPGVAEHGADLTGGLTGGAELADKIIQAANHGVDGFCLWCLTDMIYCHNQAGVVMEFGLWRYKWQGWLPRPIYWYYAALVHAFRPGARLLPVRGVPKGLRLLAARTAEGGLVCAALNTGARARRLTVALPAETATMGQWLRVHPGILPTLGDLPLDTWEPIGLEPGATLSLTLAPYELAIWRT